MPLIKSVFRRDDGPYSLLVLERCQGRGQRLRRMDV
jgi:hypothetical protein